MVTHVRSEVQSVYIYGNPVDAIVTFNYTIVIRSFIILLYLVLHLRSTNNHRIDYRSEDGSIFGVRELRDNYKPRFSDQQWNSG